ncbi:MAG: hypothetical protein L6W00_26125 [Lentisphaeria bacterium]|nr:MAG: hypothetical protein L6W00_26125 [Lentisphaeria bacterium]
MLFAHPGAWAEERPDSDTVLFSMVLLDECVRFIRRVGQEKHVYHTAAIRCRALPRIMEAILAIDQDTPLCRHLLTPLFEALSEEFNAEMRGRTAVTPGTGVETSSGVHHPQSGPRHRSQ